MTLEQAQRLVLLIRHFKRNLARNHSLLRRIMRLLDACPQDTALRKGVLNALEQALDQMCRDARVALLAVSSSEDGELVPDNDETAEGTETTDEV